MTGLLRRRSVLVARFGPRGVRVASRWSPLEGLEGSLLLLALVLPRGCSSIDSRYQRQSMIWRRLGSLYSRYRGLHVGVGVRQRRVFARGRIAVGLIVEVAFDGADVRVESVEVVRRRWRVDGRGRE